jgi:DNA-binding beta-propeller fold protein YncE
VAVSVATLTALIMAATALAVTGQLTQLSGTAGCVSETGTGGACADGKALDFAAGLAISPDGKSAYVASLNSDAVAIFQRNTTTGELTQLAGAAGCISETGSGGACADGKALDIGDSDSMTVSGDGKNLYLAAQGGGVVVFTRDTTTGELTQASGTAACISENGSGGACVDGKALNQPFSVAMSQDDKNVYVAANVSDAVAVFQRDTTTGALTQLASAAGCIRETGGGYCRDGRALDSPVSVAVSGDDKHVYVGSFMSDAIVALRRNTTTGALFQPSAKTGCISQTGTGGTCTVGKALDGVFSLALSADDKNVYVASLHSNAAAAFRRNATTGALTQLAGTAGCISETGSGGSCVDGKALSGPISVAVSADGESVYVGSTFSDAVAVFSRDATGVGGLTQLAGTAGCVSETGNSGACADGKALDYPRTVAVSADNKNAYVTSGLSSAVAVFGRQTPP